MMVPNEDGCRPEVFCEVMNELVGRPREWPDPRGGPPILQMVRHWTPEDQYEVGRHLAECPTCARECDYFWLVVLPRPLSMGEQGLMWRHLQGQGNRIDWERVARRLRGTEAGRILSQMEPGPTSPLPDGYGFDQFMSERSDQARARDADPS